MMAHPERARGTARRIGSALLCLTFALAALYFALNTLCAIINFGWREPMFDQWSEYETLLGLPFPQNVLQQVAGHRPILPNLVRVAEIRWFGADQSLQLVVGNLCAFLSAAILAGAAYGERKLPPVARWAGVMLAVLGLLWLGNARRLLHGTEALHGYMPTLAVVCACWFLYRARQRDSAIWVGAACLACTIATFSFGLGLAGFASALVLGLLLRFSWRWLALVGACLALCVGLYVFALPGNEGVRQQLQINPLATIQLTAQWTAAPWHMGWLNLVSSARPPVYQTVPESFLLESARFLIDGLGISAEQWCLALGLIGIGMFCILVVRIFLRGDTATRLETLAVGVGVYALGSALITVVARWTFCNTTGTRFLPIATSCGRACSGAASRCYCSGQSRKCAARSCARSVLERCWFCPSRYPSARTSAQSGVRLSIAARNRPPRRCAAAFTTKNIFRTNVSGARPTCARSRCCATSALPCSPTRPGSG
jgi:hypothetical protein